MGKKKAIKGQVTPPPEVVDLDIEVEGDGEVEQVKLFTLNGQDYYMVPPEANVMLKVLWQARTEGMLVAMAEMMVQLMGEDTYKVLMNYDGLTEGELKQITDRVMHYSTGRMEGLLGN